MIGKQHEREINKGSRKKERLREGHATSRKSLNTYLCYNLACNRIITEGCLISKVRGGGRGRRTRRGWSRMFRYFSVRYCWKVWS